MYTLVYSINNEEHPETVYVNLTNSCTNSCIFCLRNQKDDVCGAEMWHDDNYTLEDIIEQIYKFHALRKDNSFLQVWRAVLKTRNVERILQILKEKLSEN